MVMRVNDDRTDIPALADPPRLAWALSSGVQYLLGFVLSVTLLVKYATLLTSGMSCNNALEGILAAVQCTPSLEIVAQFLFVLAGFRFAAFMVQDRLRAIFGPLLLACVGALLSVLSRLLSEEPAFSSAATLVALLLAMCATYASQTYGRPK